MRGIQIAVIINVVIIGNALLLEEGKTYSWSEPYL